MLLGLRIPCPDPIGLPDGVEVGDQPQPRDLEDVVGVGPAQAVGAGHGPDPAAEAVDEGVPGGGLPGSGRPDQIGHRIVPRCRHGAIVGAFVHRAGLRVGTVQVRFI